MKRKSIPRRHHLPSANMRKGRMVEEIVASMHDTPGVTVQRNVRLSPVGGQKRKREIDVLLSTDVCGYPVHIAIECKNEVMPIGAKDIEAFATKLPYLGIPARHGIFVSASGYTNGAKEAAEAAGIRLLTLDDASEGLDDAMTHAIQATVYLLPVINGLTVEDLAGGPDYALVPGMFFTEQGEVCGTVQDTVWSAWIEGKLPYIIGQHEFSINLPENVYHRVGGQLVRVLAVRVKVQIVGLVLQIMGTAERHHLRNAAQNVIERAHMTAHFDVPTEGTREMITVETEEELQRLVMQPAAARIVHRVPLPRINFWNAIYWPPSERVLKVIAERLQAFEAGLIPDPRPFNIVELEGQEFSAIFERFARLAYTPLEPTDSPSNPKGSSAGDS